MAAMVFKCKMCGGSLNIENDMTVVECEYCGTNQTLPKLSSSERAERYERANHHRRNNNYDKAMAIYEQILNEDKTDAEAYWSLVLCRYGIVYVEDPKTKERIPTVNRAQYTSIFADEDYKAALEYADANQKAIYQKEARAIDKIQKGILEISQKEEPFDVFICYKESDASGKRTPDSVLAQELYYGLTQEGFKVFFARITLEDKLGSAYEPYIFAALNSSKVMVVLGTKPEYFNAVWVKNEWSRYLALIKKGEKKTIIPAYKDMDPYDLPEDFSHLQAQDMTKLGFMQDLLRGIKKIASTTPKETVSVKTSGGGDKVDVKNLLRRASMFLGDGDFSNADEYCEKVLDRDPENGEAYLYKLLAEYKIKKPENLYLCNVDFSGSVNYKKAMSFGSEAQQESLHNSLEVVQKRKRCRENLQELDATIDDGKKRIENKSVTIGECTQNINLAKWTLDYIKQALILRKIGAGIHFLGAIFILIGALIWANNPEQSRGGIILVFVLGYPTMIVGLSMMMKNYPGKRFGGGAYFWFSILIFAFDLVGLIFLIISLASTCRKDKRAANGSIEANENRIRELNQEIRSTELRIKGLSEKRIQVQEILNRLERRA